MAEKRKVKRRKDEDFDFDEKKQIKPSKDEVAVAKWLKKNVPVKKTKFAGHNVEYFTGSKAVDALLDSEWSKKKGDKEAFFITRQDIVNFLNNMLRRKFFHRAKKVPVSEQELKAKMKKKDKKGNEKEDRKKKEDETAESSHAEGKETEDKSKHGLEDRQKKCKKIKLEMHFDQMFVDNLDAYVWIFDPIPFYYWVVGALVVLGAILICLFPLWPPTVRMGVQYLSMAAAGLLILILALAVIRLIIFCLVWMLTFGTLHLWLLPNLTEDVGFFASFWPLYEYKYGKQISGGKDKKGKKKKAKDSDAEEERSDNDAEGLKEEEEQEEENVDHHLREEPHSASDRDEADSDEHGNAHRQALYEVDDEQEDEENGGADQNEEDDEEDDETYEDEEEEEEEEEEEDSEEESDEESEEEDSAEYEDEDNHHHHKNKNSTRSSKSSPKSGTQKKGDKENENKRTKSQSKNKMSRNDSEETDTESSSQHSQTGKDFEIIDKDDSDVKS